MVVPGRGPGNLGTRIYDVHVFPSTTLQHGTPCHNAPRGVHGVDSDFYSELRLVKWTSILPLLLPHGSWVSLKASPRSPPPLPPPPAAFTGNSEGTHMTYWTSFLEYRLPLLLSMLASGHRVTGLPLNDTMSAASESGLDAPKSTRENTWNIVHVVLGVLGLVLPPLGSILLWTICRRFPTNVLLDMQKSLKDTRDILKRLQESSPPDDLFPLDTEYIQ